MVCVGVEHNLGARVKLEIMADGPELCPPNVWLLETE